MSRMRAAKTSPNESTPVSIRVPKAVLEKVDASLESGDIPLSRNVWINQAILNRLKEEEEGSPTRKAENKRRAK